MIFDGVMRGDNHAIHFLYDKYAPQLRYFAFKYLNDSTEVDDILQEAYVCLWENHKRISSEFAAKGFLYKYIRNEAISRIRQRSVRERYLKLNIFEEYEESFLNNIIEAEVYDNLLHAIETLPSSCRTICQMSLDGMKLQEIADKLKVSINTIKKQKSISNARLRKIREELLSLFLSF